MSSRLATTTRGSARQTATAAREPASSIRRHGAHGRQHAAPRCSSPSRAAPKGLHDGGEAPEWEIDGVGRARVCGGSVKRTGC
jgi:hypothetical protein